MAFVEYSRSRTNIPSNYIRISQFSLRLSSELWEEMGSPKRVKLFYEEETRKVGMMKTETGGLAINSKTLSRPTKEITIRKFLEFFKIQLDNPMDCKVEIPNTSIWTFSLLKGIPV